MVSVDVFSAFKLLLFNNYCKKLKKNLSSFHFLRVDKCRFLNYFQYYFLKTDFNLFELFCKN